MKKNNMIYIEDLIDNIELYEAINYEKKYDEDRQGYDSIVFYLNLAYKTELILDLGNSTEEIYWALCTLYEIDDYSDIISCKELKEILENERR